MVPVYHVEDLVQIHVKNLKQLFHHEPLYHPDQSTRMTGIHANEQLDSLVYKEMVYQYSYSNFV